MWQHTEKPSSVTPKALRMGTEFRDGGGPSGRGGAEPGRVGQRIALRTRGFHQGLSPRGPLGPRPSQSFPMPSSTHRGRARITAKSSFSLGVLGINQRLFKSHTPASVRDSRQELSSPSCVYPNPHSGTF